MNTSVCENHPHLEKPDPEIPGAYHAPVMPEEVCAFLAPGPGRRILDATLGGGGHTRLFLDAGAEVIGADQDADALAYCAATLGDGGGRLRLLHTNFAAVAEALDGLGVELLDGVLLDLGVSSHQLDTAERGFSFHRDGPLDMRMDQSGSMSAAVLVNTAGRDELARIFREFGEEPHANRIASHLVRLRDARPFRTTGELAAAVCAVAPRTGPRHPATRVFQALRIAVNDELGALARGLETLSDRLAPGGRFAVITFHSLEDRMVKRFFRERSNEWVDRPEWPEPRRNPLHIFRLLTPSPIDPSPEETRLNPRARSAKLRVVERIPHIP